jgi:hypothetical protein
MKIVKYNKYYGQTHLMNFKSFSDENLGGHGI